MKLREFGRAMRRGRNRGKPEVFLRWVLPLILWIGGTLLFRYTDWDLRISSWFYHPDEGWVGSQTPGVTFFYKYGPWPGNLMGLVGLVAGFLSFFLKKLQPYRKIGFFLGLYAVLIPGLLVNSVLKEHYHRTRPRETQSLGGHRPFVPVLSMSDHPSDHSFPSGHAGIGFFLMAPYFFLFRQRPKWAWGFLALGLLWGGAMGICRIMEGGHFASDVFWSLALVYFGGGLLGHWFSFSRTPLEPDS